MNEEDIDFVLKAVKMVAENAWKLLPQVQIKMLVQPISHNVKLILVKGVLSLNFAINFINA